MGIPRQGQGRWGSNPEKWKLVIKLDHVGTNGELCLFIHCYIHFPNEITMYWAFAGNCRTHPFPSELSSG
jgi:hypothetical protein